MNRPIIQQEPTLYCPKLTRSIRSLQPEKRSESGSVSATCVNECGARPLHRSWLRFQRSVFALPSVLLTNGRWLCWAFYHCTRTRCAPTEEVAVFVYLFVNPCGPFGGSIWFGRRQLSECLYALYKQTRTAKGDGERLWNQFCWSRQRTERTDQWAGPGQDSAKLHQSRRFNPPRGHHILVAFMKPW